MIKNIRIIVLFATLLVFLYLVNTGIMSSEQNIANGTLAYFKLAPVDPRSLIQGDYMQLDYALENDANQQGLDTVRRGQLVLYLDEQHIAHFSREYHEGETLEENEVIVNFYALDDWRGVRVGVDSFLFQEGLADTYANAEYAGVRIFDANVMLIDLVGANLEPLVP